MRTNWFIIYEAQRGWWIDNEGTEFGPFETRELAGAEALSIARSFGDKSRRSQVFWPADDGRQRMIWEGV